MALDQETLMNVTADIASAHVGNNKVLTGEVAPLIESIYSALQALGAPTPDPIEEKPVGAVSIRASIKPGHLVSMIDGKPYKMLKRHLGLHGYTPASYREAFNLPRDYPMVAAEYAEKRSALAKSIGLGRKAASAKATKPARLPRITKSAATSPQPSEANEPTD